LHLQGRKAARVRSKELDKLANAADQLLARYADGLDAKVQKNAGPTENAFSKSWVAKRKTGTITAGICGTSFATTRHYRA
jgi:hypothetical protein